MAVTDYSGARKERTGWTHLLSIKVDGEDTTWGNRVTSWGDFRRSVSDYQRSEIGGNEGIKIADTDMEIWGSVYSGGKYDLLWTPVEIISKLGGPDGTFTFNDGDESAKFGVFRFGQARFGDLIFLGGERRISGFEVEDNEIEISLFDNLEGVRTSKFIWDYQTLRSEDPASGVYGTVHSIIDATSILVKQNPGAAYGAVSLRGRINNLIVQRRLRTHPEVWSRLNAYGVLTKDDILPGDYIKFGTVDEPNPSVAGLMLKNNPRYALTSGSFRTFSGVTFATFQFSSDIKNVFPGQFIFKRTPLVYEGNPAEIVYNIVTGPNTTLQIPTGSVSQDHYQAAVSACSPMNFKRTIDDENEGALLREIMAISEPLDAKFFFDRSQRWCWIPYRPRMSDRDIDDMTDSYDAHWLGLGNITGKVKWTIDANSIVTNLRIMYGFDEFELDKGFDFQKEIDIDSPAISTRYNGMQRSRVIESRWLHSSHEAVVIGNRIIRRRENGVRYVSMFTSLYGLEEELYNVRNISSRVANMTNAPFSIESIDMDIDKNTIALNMESIDREYKGNGFGYYLPVNAGSTIGNVVSGTSKSGWSWLDTTLAARHGTIGSMDVAGGGSSWIVLDKTGLELQVGSNGYAEYITVGSEIVKVVGTVGGGTSDWKLISRGMFTTDETHPHSTGDPIVVWPTYDGKFNPIFRSGTIFGAPSGADFATGTVHNINVTNWGTVWRWF